VIGDERQLRITDQAPDAADGARPGEQLAPERLVPPVDERDREEPVARVGRVELRDEAEVVLENARVDRLRGDVDHARTRCPQEAEHEAQEALLVRGEDRHEVVGDVDADRVHDDHGPLDVADRPQRQIGSGDRRRITQCALNPELRNGIATYEVVTPGERYDMAPPCFAMAHHLREGHRLVLRVSTADPDKVPLFAIDPQVTVFMGEGATRVDVPVVANPALYPDDVPFLHNAPTGPAAAPIDRTVTTASLGAPARIAGLTSQFIAFTVPENSDTAGGDVTATVSLPADIDLFLQRRLVDGSWSGDISVGGSSSLSGEAMSIDRRLTPGTYRIEVHNFAGPPGNAVRVQAVFRDSTGVPG
jgi:hypothetical protein